MTVTHPLEMLSGDEISRAGAIVRADARFPEGATFVHVVAPRARQGRRWRPAPPDRAVEVQLVDGPGLGVDRGRRRRSTDGDGHQLGRRSRASARRCCSARRCTRSSPPRSTPSTSPRSPGAGITDVDNVQIDPWPAGVFGYDAEDDRRIARCISFLRTDPQDNGYARPIEGLIVHFDLGRNEVIDVIDHGVVTMPEQPRALLRGRQRAAAHRPEADPHHPARGSELHRRRQPDPLAEVGVPHHVRPVRGAGAPPAHLRRRRARAADPAPRVDLRDGRPLRRSRRARRAGRTRSTPASGASGA